MGFRDLVTFNKALLAKQIWRMILFSDSLIARVFKVRYFKHMDIMEAMAGSNASYIWRSILWSRDILTKGIVWKVNDGLNINARKDQWIPDLTSGRITSSISFDNNVNVKEFINQSNKF